MDLLLHESIHKRVLWRCLILFKKILSKKRTTNIHYSEGELPEIIHALSYLNKYSNQNPKIPKLKEWISKKKMEFLGV